MTDFFTNLLARSFGGSSGVRPLLPSLFEPIGEAVTTFVDTGCGSEAVSDEMRETEGKGQSHYRERRPSKVGPVNTKQTRNRYDPETTEAASAMLTVHDRLHQRGFDVVDATSENCQSENAQQSHNLASLPPARLDVRVDGSSLEPETNGPEVIREHDETGFQSESTEVNVIPDARHGRPRASQKRNTSESPSDSGHAAMAAENSLVIPAKIPRLSELALSVKPSRGSVSYGRSGQSDVSLQAEPNVQVTIGRIEVRATKERTPSARRASPSPVMSLEEYLRGRARRSSQ